MGFRVDIELSTGEVCPFHAVHCFTFNEWGGCEATIGAYRDELSALINIRPVESHVIRCDGVTASEDVARQIYCIAAKDPRYAGASSFSDDAAYGLANPRDPLPERQPAPSDYHKWDPASWCWTISEEGISMLKEAAKQGINAARDNEERSGFVAFGKVFDSDSKSIQRITVAAQAASLAKSNGVSYSVEWTTADNSTLILDADQVMQLPIIMAETANAIHQKARTLKALIDAAGSVEEINEIHW